MPRGRPKKNQTEVKPVDEAKDKAQEVPEPVATSANANDETRQTVIKTLTDIGVKVDEAKSTKELLNDLSLHLIEFNNKSINSEVDLIKTRVRSIKDHTNLSSEEFIARLITLGVPEFYLTKLEKNGQPWFLFSDGDEKLSDKDIWHKIRFSNVNPIATTSLFNKKIKRPERYHFGSKVR